VGLLEELSSYLDGELSPSRCAAMEAHLASCPCCGVLADRLRRAVAICRVSGMSRLPADVRSRAKARISDLLDAAAPTRRRAGTRRPAATKRRARR
jgi:anti-sigma factor RsiW